MKKIFSAEQFTPTKWNTAEDKAKFANHFVRFVESQFNENLFHKDFYNRLSMCFSHIAHYDRNGFYHTWFSTLTRRLRFLEHTATYPGIGDSAWTYSDVEYVIAKWVKGSGWIEKYEQKDNEKKEREEREELARLKAKYERHEMSSAA